MSEIAIFYSATNLRHDHMYDVKCYGCDIRAFHRQVTACWCLGTRVPSLVSHLLPNHYCNNNMDRASQVLTQGVPLGVPRLYCALTDHGNVPCATLYYHAHRQRSKEKKTQSQQYLTPWEEDVVIKYLLQMSDLGQLIHSWNSNATKASYECWQYLSNSSSSLNSQHFNISQWTTTITACSFASSLCIHCNLTESIDVQDDEQKKMKKTLHWMKEWW